MRTITFSDRDPRVRRTFGVVLALVAGMAIATQARVNGQLAIDLDDALLAAALSFAGGLLVLLTLVPLLPRMRAGVHRLRASLEAGAIRPWQLLGGLAGALMIATQALTVGVLGVSMLTVGLVAGQTVSSLFVDRIGLGPAGARPLTTFRVAGAGLMVVAILVTVGGGITIAGDQVWLLALPVACGFAVAVQQAVNGLVGAAARNAMTATLVNFTVGTTVLGLAWVISYLLTGGPRSFPANPVLYLGGLVGIGFIALAAFVVRWIGVLLLGLASIAGQLIGSVLLDVVLPVHGTGVADTTLVGVAVAMFAVAVAAVPRRRRR